MPRSPRAGRRCSPSSPAPEFASAAANELAAALAKEPEQFKSVAQPEGGAFFEHNGLLYLPADKVEQTTKQLVQARPLINTLAHDPTLTGLAQTLNTTLNVPLLTGQIQSRPDGASARS